MADAVVTRVFLVFLGVVGACSLETNAIGGVSESASDDVGVPSVPSRERGDGSVVDARGGDTVSMPSAVPDPDVDMEPDAVASDADVLGSGNDAGGHDAGSGVNAGDAGALSAPWPAVSDVWQAGPYVPAAQAGASNGVVFYPDELASSARRWPVVIWDNAAGIYGPVAYRGLLEHLASHGFVVFAANASTAEGTEVLDGLAWILAENERSGSPYFHKLDAARVAAMGHALGSIATFAVASDPRLTTTLHLSGATHDAYGTGHAMLGHMLHPAAFICDSTGGNSARLADPDASCQHDFEQTASPVFFATLTAGEQLNLPLNARGAIVSWLRWHLMADATMKTMFVGSPCTLCTRPNWAAQQRELDVVP